MIANLHPETNWKLSQTVAIKKLGKPNDAWTRSSTQPNEMIESLQQIAALGTRAKEERRTGDCSLQTDSPGQKQADSRCLARTDSEVFNKA